MLGYKLPQLLPLLVVLLSAAVDGDRQGAGRRLASPQQQPTSNSRDVHFKSSCGSSEQVSHMIGQCIGPLFDMIEGRVSVPKSDSDIIANCERFSNAEKCVRQVARDCLSGFSKTAINTVPGAIKRFRNSECKSTETRAKYIEVVRCAVKRAKGVQALYRNHTAIGQNIRDLPGDTAEQKIMKFCCLLNSLDRELAHQFETDCPKETPIILSMIHAITDDARNTLCVNPKCQNALQKVIPARMKQTQQNFIEPIVQILFLLTTDAD